MSSSQVMDCFADNTSALHRVKSSHGTGDQQGKGNGHGFYRNKTTTTKTAIIRLFWLLILTTLTSTASANDTVSWNSEQFIALHGDINGDGRDDLLLQPRGSETGSVTFQSASRQYLTDDSHFLTFLPDYASARLLLADINGDGKDDLVTISAGEARVRLSNGSGFAEVSQTLSNPESLHFLNAFDAYLYYAGDFNGDGRDEFIALSDNPHRHDRAHVLMQTEDNGQLNVHQSPGEEAVWATQQSSRLIIADYNNDGRDDIFAVARKANDPHWLVLSSDKGRFSSRGQQIRHRLTNHDWDDERHSIMAINGLLTPGVELLRRNNRPGGFDERGEWHSQSSGEPGDVVARQSSGSASVTNKQAPVNPDTVKPHALRTPDNTDAIDSASTDAIDSASTDAIDSASTDAIDSASTDAIDCNDPLYNPTSGTEGSGCSFLTLPDTPTDYPTISGSAYKPLNIGFHVGFTSVSGATYYELYAGDGGLDPAAVTYTKVYSGSVFQPTFSYSTAGHRYYKYKACNSVGCSGLSPWRRIYVYDAPEAIRSPVLSATSVYSNATVSLDFVEAGYSVDGTNHKVWQSFNGGAETLIYDFTRTQWQQNQHHVSKSLNEPGSYVWRAQACSPSVGCGPSTSFTITVTNRAPVAVADTFTHLLEDTPAALSVLANDTDPDGHLISLHDIRAVPLGGQVVINGNQAVYTPYNQWCGDDRFTYRVKDAFGAVSSAVLVSLTVNCVNDAPYVSHLSAGYTVNEDTSATITYTLRDFDSDVNAASVSVLSSSNPAVLPLANIVPGGSGTARTLQLQGAAHQHGSSDVTFRVSDGTDAQDYTFNVVIHPVNDLPVATGLAGHVLTEDTPLTIVVPVADVETPASALTLTSVGSSNYTVLPTPNVVISGSGATRRITLTPAANQSGSGIIWLQLSDGTDSATYGLTFTVNPVNDTPTAGPLSGHVFDEDTSQAITLTLNDVETPASEVVLRVKGSSNTALVPVSNAVISGSGNTRTLTLTPAANHSGSGTIWLGVHDGTVEATYGLSYTVNPVNDAPTVSTIAMQVMNEDETLQVPFTIADIDTDISQLSLSATAGNPLLVNTTDITFSGSGQSRTMTITPLPGRDGETDITVHVNDGTQTTSRTFHLTVNGVNDAPVLSVIADIQLNEDATNITPITVSDVETPASQFSLQAISSSNPALLPLSNITFSGSGGSRYLTLAPTANMHGVSTVTVAVSDGELSTSATFTVTVLSINDLPVIQPLADVNMLTRQVLSVPLVVSDVETPLENLTITASAHDPSLISPDRLVPQFVNGQHVLQVTAGSSPGSTPVDVRVHDGTTSRKTTLNVTIVRPPEPPTITGVPPSTVRVGQAYDFTPGAEDRNPGDTLTFVSANLPAWLTFDAATGRIHGTPGTLDIGTRSGIRLGVTDSYNYPGEGLKYVYLNDFAITVQQAQTPANPETPVAPTVFTDPGVDPASEKVGRLNGQASVSGSGGAVWSLPVALPSGKGGLTPALTLGYNSQGANSMLGVGWSVQGARRIARCRQTIVDDGHPLPVNFDDNDALCLDGQRLRLTAGTHWQQGAVYQPDRYTGERVVLHRSGNDITFRVDNGNGGQSWFGETADSVKHNTRHGADYEWSLNRITDVFGQSVQYHWHPAQNELSRMSGISWSGHKVEFVYESRADTNHFFFKGDEKQATVRLKTLNIFRAERPDAAMDSYHFAYQTSTTTSRSLLSSITRCNGSLTGVCLPATTFTWHQPSVGLAAQATHIDVKSWLPAGAEIKQIETTAMNDDGMPDLMVIYQDSADNWLMRLGQGDGSRFTDTGIDVPLPASYDGRMQQSDFDNNGISDLWLDGVVWYASGDGTYEQVSIDNLEQLSVADFDGNGLPDLVSVREVFLNKPGQTRATRFKTSTPLFSEQALLEQIRTPTYITNDDRTGSEDLTRTGGHARDIWRDLDGDGQLDLIMAVTNHVVDVVLAPPGQQVETWDHSQQVYHITRTADSQWTARTPVEGLSSHEWDNASGMYAPGQLSRSGDVNGDGLADSGRFVANGVGVEYVYEPWSFGQFSFRQPGSTIDGFAAAQTDLNQDGRMDFVRYNPEADEYEVLLGWQGGTREGQVFARHLGLTRSHIKIPETVDGSDLQLSIKNVLWADMDGDGYPGLIAADYIFGTVRLWHDANTDGTPGDVLLSVTDGFGATARWQYGPSRDTALYQMGEFGAVSVDAGDGAVREARPSHYLVSDLRIEHGADAQGNPFSSHQRFAYKGYRMQLGGRGALGMECMTRQDVVNDNRTEHCYYQAFPHTGQIKSIRHWQGDRLMADTRAATPQVFSLNNGRNYFVAAGSTTGVQYALDSDLAAGDGLATTPWPVSSQTTDSQYEVAADGHTIHLKKTTVTTADLLTNEADKVVTTTRSWYPVDERWFTNQLKTESVSLAQAGKTTLKTTSGLHYDDITGQQTVVNRNTQGNEYTYLRTETVRDALGHAIRVTQCSSHFVTNKLSGTQQCSDGMGTTVDDPYKVFRRVEQQWDSTGRYLVSTGNGLFTQMQYSQFSERGQPQVTTDADGASTYTGYDTFGRAYYTASDDGSYQVTRQALCANTTTCPASATVETTVTGAGEVTAVSWQDLSGREVRSAANRLDGRLAFTDTVYNHKGQAVSVTAPYFTGETPVKTRFSYDGLGRQQQEIRPDDTVITTTLNQGVTATRVQGNWSGTDWATATDRTRSQTANGFGELTVSTDELGHEVRYEYDAGGNLVRTRNADGSDILTPHDALGRQQSLTDPDKGFHRYQYNALGELIHTSTPGSSDNTFITETSTMDGAGRMVKRVMTDGQGSVVDTLIRHYNGHRLQQETFDSRDTANTATQYFYDSLGRMNKSSVNLGGSVYHTQTTFDEYGRVFQQFDALGDAYGLRYHYQHGFVVKQQEARDGEQGVVYVTTDQMDARGNVLQQTAGNGLITGRQYDRNTGFLTRITTGNLQQLDYEYDGLGNLRARLDLNTRLGPQKREHFEYDALSRVTSAYLTAGSTPTVRTHQISYTANGNIQTNSTTEAGATYQYGQSVIACSITPGLHALSAVGSLNFCYDNRGNQTKRWRNSTLTRDVTYSAFDKPVEINSIVQGETRTTRFTYDGNRSRWLRTDEENGEITTTLYVGNLEIETKPDGSTQTKRYVGGHVIDTHRSDGTRTTHYLTHDHLGSIDVITDETGAPVQNLSFDLWGNRRQVEDWSAMQQAFVDRGLTDLLNITQRGFTGHEHVDHADVIHMNGRIYDPTLGRFMQADPIVQAPDNLQSLNRYSYVFNNPLSYTDPTGYRGLTLCGGSCFLSTHDDSFYPAAEIMANMGGYSGMFMNGGRLEFGFARASRAAASFSFDTHFVNALIAMNKTKVTVTDCGSGGCSSGQSGSSSSTRSETGHSSFKWLAMADNSGGLGGMLNRQNISLASGDISSEQYAENIQTIGQGGVTGAMMVLPVDDVALVAVGAVKVGGYLVKGAQNAGKVIKKTREALKNRAKLDKKAPCNCFVAGTEVTTKEGYKAIEDITVGDEVLAKNVLTGEQAWKPVTQTFVIPDNRLYEILLDTGKDRPLTLEASATHPFYIPAKGWRTTTELTPGDVIETDGQTSARVISVNDLHNNALTYNFAVADFETYYVSRERVLVHNCPEVDEVAKNGVKFGQGSVKNTFAHGPFKGRTIGDVADGLRSGKISPDSLPVEFIVRNGERVALNNRSMTALRRAGMEPTKLINRTGSKTHERLLDSHLRGGQPSDVIRIRGAGLGASSIE